MMRILFKMKHCERGNVARRGMRRFLMIMILGLPFHAPIDGYKYTKKSQDLLTSLKLLQCPSFLFINPFLRDSEAISGKHTLTVITVVQQESHRKLGASISREEGTRSPTPLLLDS